MTCKGMFCERSAQCRDTQCPGHPKYSDPIDQQISTWLSAIAWAFILCVAVGSFLLIARP